MSLYAILCILASLAFLGCYIAYFVLGKKGKRTPLLGKVFLGLILGFAALLHVFLVLEGISLFQVEAPTQSYFIGLLLGLFLASCFFYPFAKKIGSKATAITLTAFLLSGLAFLADAISISYALLNAQ